ncbi:outer membrane beta-barrel family protein [Ohtaekwangia koreensis]|uniref:CarboxypepD_reg-like domain-containing protein n=1 Tax=Ohtaekwangia koreensis TaxID=688867 RepID=A0A1T5L6E1_9BACT|nr:outer membrane beta-barrel family protein [Ohtaekwangia koreensis]SKC71480.1 CarboxypepD_reg-like domain-containing protein [Ohtaekwangia koreensis]
MKRLLIFLLFITQLSLAQKITITGQVVDSVSHALQGATVILLNPKDSSLVNFGASNNSGQFEIKNLEKIEYILKITYVGYKTYSSLLHVTESEVMDLGLIKMYPAQTKLDEVVIQSEKIPVVIKRDTIEYNALAFKTNQNSNVEELLKKLPGVEVDNDGTIRSQGEQVKRITVDGKTFFGTDPKLATRNLPADAIDKVQVFDKKSDQATFSGIDDGQREKTINLELKEEKRNGIFGNVQGGVGTDDRFAAKANLNRFRKGQQLSVLGMANNTNEQGFSMEEYMSFTGGAQQLMSGRGQVSVQLNSNNQSGIPLNIGGRNSGIMTNYAGGVNFNNEFNKKTELNTSYFYNYLDHDIDATTERTNYLSNGNLQFNQHSRQLNTNANHRVNATLEHKLDSMNSLKMVTSVTYNETESNTKSESQNLDAGGILQNESIGSTSSAGSSVNLNTNLLWRHRFSRKGRTLSVNGQLSVTDSDRDGDQNATNIYYTEGEMVNNVLQTNIQETNTVSYSGTLSYTEPLGKRRYLEANYTFRQNLNDVDKRVYDVENEDYVFNSSLSNQYKSDYQYHRAGLNLRMVRSNYNLTFGSSLQQTYLDGDLILLDQKISKSYQNILPVAHFNYDFSTTKHLRFDYETSVQEPTIQQLQPVVDNSDQLNWYIGNPNLRPAYAHNARLNFMTFEPGKFVSFFAFVDATYTKNSITTAQSYTEEQVRISTPVNVSSNTRINTDATFSFPIQKFGSRFSLSANVTRQSGVNVVEEVESGILQKTYGGRLRYDYRYKEVFDASLSANISRQSTDYEFNKSSNQLYFNKTYTAEANLTILKNYQLSSSLEYLVYESKTTDYKQSIPLVNLSISRFLLKAKSGELKFSVNNLLDKNIGVSQTADVNYFQRQTTNSLGRYYMVSFIYAINKQLNPMGMRPPRGGMMRIIR